jgi:hypothetical protein
MASSTTPAAPLPLTQAPSSAPTQKDAAVPVTTEVAALETAGKANLAGQPLPVVKAKQAASPTAVSRPTPSAKPIRQANGAPAVAAPASDQPLVVVTSPTTAPPTPAKGQQAAPSTEKGKTERPLVRPKTQVSPQAPVPPAKPVIKPRATARKAPITFPSATSAAATANGRSQTTNLADGLLPVVRSEQAQVFQSPAALPLPKTAVVAPSRPAPALPTTASSGVSGGSGVIQRSPTDEAPEATNAPAETVDIDEIVAEVQRQFMRELAIEGERRGVTSWY